MKLSDAWLNLLDIEGSEKFNNKQVYSMLADFGVFKETPKLKLCVKIALENGLWNLVVSKPSNIQILDLKLKLQNEGFSYEVIDDIIGSFYEGEYNNAESRSHSSISEQITTCGLDLKIPKQILGRNVIKYHSNNTNGLNHLLYYIPDLNKDNNITIQSLDCSLKTIQEISLLNKDFFLSYRTSIDKVICLEFDITNNYGTTTSLNPNAILLHFAAFVISKEGRISSKTYITSIKKNEKYEIAKGAREINNSLPIEDIAAIIIYPENGDIDINSDYSMCSDKEFKKFNGKIEIEPFTKKCNDINIKLSNIQIWGNKSQCSIAFEVRGNTTANKGWRIGKQLRIAWFNKENRLIEKSDLFIGKTGWVGSRGGLHETWMNHSSVSLLYFKYIDLINIEEVSKVIISDL